MMASASLIVAPLAGAAEVPDVPAKPIPAATSIAIKMVRIRRLHPCFFGPATLARTMSLPCGEPPIRPIQIRSSVARPNNQGRKRFVPEQGKSIFSLRRSIAHESKCQFRDRRHD
jgi:hypothetical protein